MLAVVLSALFAGLVAIGVTVSIERFGGRLGGVLGTMPWTIVPAAIGIYVAGGAGDPFARSMATVPVGMLLNGVFLWLWRTLPPRLPSAQVRARLVIMISLSLSIWLAGAIVSTVLLGQLGETTQPALIAGIGCTVLLFSLGLWSLRSPVAAPKGGKRVGVAALLARGVMAALAIGVCVVIAEFGGDLAAGVASVFPAIFMTTMVSLWIDQGEAVPIGAAGPMILGSTSVGVYALLSIETVAAFGIGLGSLVAWVMAVVTVSLPAAFWLRRGQDVGTSTNG